MSDKVVEGRLIPIELTEDYPPYKEGYVTVQMHKDDLNILVNLLSTTQEVFTRILVDATTRGDEPTTKAYVARVKLCNAFVEKLGEQIKLGEPVSREKH